MLEAKDASVELTRRAEEASRLPRGATVFTQRLFVASPRGRYLAYADGTSRQLRVRDRRGRERVVEHAAGRDARFSADERFLATLRVSTTHRNGTDLVLLDLATGAARVLTAGLDHPQWIEWIAGGVVVSHLDGTDTALSYAPLDGELRRLATSPTLQARFTAARRGTRVLYLDGQRVFVTDIGATAHARVVGELEAAADNLEMAPDGSQAALVAGAAIHRWVAGQDGVSLLVRSTPHHTVWYSADSRQLAYASNRRVAVIANGRSYSLVEDTAEVHSMRFRPRGGGLVIATGNQAFVWDPVTDRRTQLARASAGETIDVADVYDGGAVTWRHRR